jgi:hypothetical protein
VTKQILCVVLFCLGSVSFVAWRVYAVRNRETAHFAIVKDPSVSHGNGCASLIGLAGQVFEANEVTSGSTITVLVLGDQSTANEPWRLGVYPVPTIRKVLEGKAAKRRLQQQILADISGKCRALRRTTISPIFLGVAQAVDDLRGRGCTATSQCRLFVDSDLEENGEPSIRNMLSKGESSKHISLPRVDNSGIAVVFCGVAVTDGRVRDRVENGARRFMTRDSDRLRRTKEIWRSLFAKPASVTFEPYCPNYSDPERGMNRHGETDASS